MLNYICLCIFVIEATGAPFGPQLRSMIDTPLRPHENGRPGYEYAVHQGTPNSTWNVNNSMSSRPQNHKPAGEVPFYREPASRPSLSNEQTVAKNRREPRSILYTPGIPGRPGMPGLPGLPGLPGTPGTPGHVRFARESGSEETTQAGIGDQINTTEIDTDSLPELPIDPIGSQNLAAYGGYQPYPNYRPFGQDRNQPYNYAQAYPGYAIASSQLPGRQYYNGGGGGATCPYPGVYCPGGQYYPGGRFPPYPNYPGFQPIG